MRIVKSNTHYPLISSCVWINIVILYACIKVIDKPIHDILWIITIGLCFIFWLFINWKIEFKRNEMKSYISIYFDHFGYDESDFINCELCSSKAVDIHHINARGMAGSKNKDTIDNLMAVCRICHIKFGDKKMYIDFLKEKHNEVLEKFKRNK